MSLRNVKLGARRDIIQSANKSSMETFKANNILHYNYFEVRLIGHN